MHAELLLHEPRVGRDEGVHIVPPPYHQRREVLLLLRNPQRRVRFGVELGSGPRHTVGVGGFCHLLRHSRFSGEAAQAQGHVTGEGVVHPAWDACGKSWKQEFSWIDAFFFLWGGNWKIAVFEKIYCNIREENYRSDGTQVAHLEFLTDCAVVSTLLHKCWVAACALCYDSGLPCLPGI